MVHSAESKQDPSRHFGFKQKPRSSTSSVGKGTKRNVRKNSVTIPSRHVSRKDLFYGFHARRSTPPVNLKQKTIPQVKELGEEFWREHKSRMLSSNTKIPKVMHPEEVQISRPMEGLVEEKLIKPQEVVEDEIDVEEVDNGDLNNTVGAKDELNGNGFHHKENGHSLQRENEKKEIFGEDKAEAVNAGTNGADVKSVLRLKSSRRNSTSSRSSSVSSARSLKQQLPLALQMEVSVDDQSGDHMDPLIIEGTAEDLEVSLSASHDEADDGVTTDSEAVLEPPNDLEDSEGDISLESEPMVEPNISVKKSKSSKTSKSVKAIKSPVKTKAEAKMHQEKVKTPRTKSLKSKFNKQSPKPIDKIFDEVDTENSDTNSLFKDDESEDVYMKSQKSPPKRLKPSPSKQELLEEAEIDEKSEAAPRRSSRTRQTPQKYNSSLYVDSLWDDERLNNSDAAFTNSIRSVRGRRSLRKSRNISALNSSLHNDSSPWDSEFKVLTPCGGGISVHDASVVDIVDNSTPLKRKAEDENEDENDRGQKKICVENTDLDNSTSSLTSSFFSIITSPIVMLKNKLRGSSVSCSTPAKENVGASTLEDLAATEKMEDVIPTDIKIEENVEVDVAPENNEDVVPPLVQSTVPEAETRSWCTVM